MFRYLTIRAAAAGGADLILMPTTRGAGKSERLGNPGIPARSQQTAFHGTRDERRRIQTLDDRK